ncbi:MAG TPA: peptidylprolyl isomerase [Candidatus Eremiobacteraceae bacterium]|nr:peptidylprolyl isomerase [Candidatus Eremiobacteraceae bacterium]
MRALMTRRLPSIIVVALASVALPLAIAAAPTPAPSSSNLALPSPTPNARATATPSPTPTPVTNVLPPPSPSEPDTTTIGKIGSLERAGAGPLKATDHHPQRATSPSQLANYLKDSDPAIQARAAIAIGRLRYSSGVGPLVQVLQSQTASDDVKADAAFALGVIHSPDAEGPLEGAALHGSSAVAGAAADALGRIGGDSVIDTLDRLVKSRDPYVRGMAAIGIGEATTPLAPPRTIDTAYRINAGVAVATAMTYERDPEAKWREAWAIGRSLYDVDQQSLRTMIADPSELVRQYAAQGMRRLKDQKYALALHLAVNDPSWRVRVEVARALAVFRDNTRVDLTPPTIPASDQQMPQALPTSAPYGPHPQVAIVTSKGIIVVEMFPDEAPYNVDNFLYLVDRGYYNNQQLFRVIQNFVIQGGDPTNGGNDGGPGYSVPAELNPLQQLTGVLALGLDYPDNIHADVDSGGSQFYITESPQLHLDINFTTMGRVVKGMAVVDAIRVHDAESAADRAKPADIVKRMFRCQPVTPQTPDIEHLLRTGEIGYNAQ